MENQSLRSNLPWFFEVQRKSGLRTAFGIASGVTWTKNTKPENAYFPLESRLVTGGGLCEHVLFLFIFHGKSSCSPPPTKTTGFFEREHAALQMGLSKAKT